MFPRKSEHINKKDISIERVLTNKALFLVHAILQQQTVQEAMTRVRRNTAASHDVAYVQTMGVRCFARTNDIEGRHLLANAAVVDPRARRWPRAVVAVALALAAKTNRRRTYEDIRRV